MFGIKPSALVGMLMLTACAANPAPRNALPEASGALHDGYGAYVVAERASGLSVQGELIAASTDTLWVLHDGGLSALAREDLRRATAALFGNPTAAYSSWVALGTLATISNGWLLAITAPMWVIGGSVTLATLSRQPLYRWQARQPLSDIAQFARFPGGIPESLDRSTLVLPQKMRQ